MVQRPAWLTRSAMTMVAALLFVGCNGVAATPTPGATTAPTPAVTGTPAASETPGESPSAAPTGTPYPDSTVPASEPSSITDSYPNYGDGVDCDAGTFNGRPYTGTVKSITAPDDHTVVFTLCA